MRTTMRYLAAAAFAAVAVGLTTAQQPGQGRGGPGGWGGGMMGGPAMLVANKAVQEDIKLTDEQKGKLTDWVKESGPKMREKMGDVFKDAAGDREKMAAAMADMQKEVYKELATVLDEKQVKRVKQIEVQAAGVRAFSRPDVLAALKLTDDQKGKLKDINDEYRKDMEDLRQGNSRPDGQKVAALNKETFEKAAGVLTDDQKTAWKDLTGEPFDTSKLQQGFGGRGGAPGGRRPGGTNNNN